LFDQKLSEEVKQKYIYPSLSSLYMQNFLINDIIDFSQITANVLEIRYSTFTLSELIDELTQLFSYYYRMKKLGLAFKINESVPHKVKSDYQRLL
jgi:signal transduction histidine kinase